MYYAMSVSYTHLDVYKRQFPLCALKMKKSCVLLLLFSLLYRENASFSSSSSAAKHKVTTAITVTHYVDDDVPSVFAEINSDIRATLPPGAAYSCEHPGQIRSLGPLYVLSLIHIYSSSTRYASNSLQLLWQCSNFTSTSQCITRLNILEIFLK